MRTRIANLRRGVVPFREPGLDEAVSAGLTSGRLGFASAPDAARNSDAVIIAVGTLDDNGKWTAAQVERAVVDLVADAAAPRLIIIRSTLLPGTTARLAAQAATIDERVDIAFNPEFTREGAAVRDFFTPDRLVIGATRPPASSPAVEILRRTYAPLSAPVVVTDATSAELIKVAANVFLATKAGFANELARAIGRSRRRCERSGLTRSALTIASGAHSCRLDRASEGRACPPRRAPCPSSPRSSIPACRSWPPSQRRTPCSPNG